MAEKAFGLGRICEALAVSRNIVLAKTDFHTAVNKLAKQRLYLVFNNRNMIHRISLDSQSSGGIQLCYAGVIYNEAPAGQKYRERVSEILLAEDNQRRISVNVGILNVSDCIKVVDLRERCALRALLKKSPTVKDDYANFSITRAIADTSCVQEYLETLLGKPAIVSGD